MNIPWSEDSVKTYEWYDGKRISVIHLWGCEEEHSKVCYEL